MGDKFEIELKNGKKEGGQNNTVRRKRNVFVRFFLEIKQLKSFLLNIREVRLHIDIFVLRHIVELVHMKMRRREALNYRFSILRNR